MARETKTGQQRGFTLIELILVIILLGILGLTAASRLFGRSSFDAHLARDQAISLARQIQLRAMNNQDAQGVLDDCLVLTVQPDHFGPAACADSTYSGRALTTANDGMTITSPTLSAVRFDLLGRPYQLTNTNGRDYLCRTDDCQVTFTARNLQSASLCLNREGYVYACP
ncbi:prepilin-type N-terminal cleavage/methylation domain-containing protein [Photobacterium sp. 1_MG-2023]|uniref:prepilin-type N-terminal cleavage/methylation domain-containing protein n=1 Tax=Photobacterium sp. 1_MG-2023 TaxID=3062646 RepID=UPI0026E124A9|nr:prepilin-type N-terminal cleavage/methylation domain-containing protein [Photobacterium sp. 1_MG-2023]MDO6706386.1 prepilin-type N-terminal cleavage/methylation domain-containing protein [Photobacterium sp. 1_MG-2023]